MVRRFRGSDWAALLDRIAVPTLAAKASAVGATVGLAVDTRPARRRTR
jgi:hypothetical protein